MSTLQFFRHPQDLDAHAPPGTIETKFLDFKATLHNWDVPAGAPNRARLTREAQKETCRDIAQFANTDGGAVIVGVGEHRDPATRLKVADPIAGIAAPDDMRQWIEDAVQNFLTPRTFSKSIDVLTHQQGTVLAVNVQPSRYIVSLWDRQEGTVEYLYRTSHGKAYMNPDEAEVQIMNSSRFGRIVLARALEKYAADSRTAGQGAPRVDLAGGIWERTTNDLHKWPGLTVQVNGPRNDDEDTFDLHVFGVGSSGKRVQIPLTAIKDAWLGSDGQARPAIGLLLTVRIVTQQNNSEFGLEPYAGT